MGLEHLFEIWDLQAPLRNYGRRVGRAGVGRDGDTASGTKDLTMLDPKVGLKT